MPRASLPIRARPQTFSVRRVASSRARLGQRSKITSHDPCGRPGPRSVPSPISAGREPPGWPLLAFRVLVSSESPVPVPAPMLPLPAPSPSASLAWPGFGAGSGSIEAGTGTGDSELTRKAASACGAGAGPLTRMRRPQSVLPRDPAWRRPPRALRCLHSSGFRPERRRAAGAGEQPTCVGGRASRRLTGRRSRRLSVPGAGSRAVGRARRQNGQTVKRICAFQILHHKLPSTRHPSCIGFTKKTWICEMEFCRLKASLATAARPSPSSAG